MEKVFKSMLFRWNSRESRVDRDSRRIKFGLEERYNHSSDTRKLDGYPFLFQCFDFESAMVHFQFLAVPEEIQFDKNIYHKRNVLCH